MPFPRRRWPLRALRVATGFSLASSGAPSLVAGFQAFAGVEEIAPHRIEEYCSERDHRTGLAHCHQSVEKTLDDGGEVALGWYMHVNPDRLLSLDTEREHGVKLTRCAPGELHLELPDAHYARHIKVGTVIVASHFAHQCEHVGRRHMYHRIIAVENTRWIGESTSRTASARLLTEELPSLAHAVPSLSFNFSYMPLEARDVVPYPRMRTAVPPRALQPRGAQQREQSAQSEQRAQSEQSGERRLHGIGAQPFGTGGGAPYGLGTGLNPGIFEAPHGFGSSGIETMDQLLSLIPKQISNFGWNWNFLMNSTEEPEFNYTIPGINGFMKLKQPYIKVHAGIYLNFTSHFSSVMKVPHVIWKAGINGHGVVNGRMMTDIKTTSSITEDPFNRFQIPVLEELRDVMWFEKIDFAAGAIPLSVEPGFQFKAEMYHTGSFDGTVQLGGKTHAVVKPEIRFDSELGLFSGIQADFKDTDLYPPLWIISTNHFEMGLALEPNLWLRGQFGQTENTRAGFEMRPYLNLSISRDGSDIVGKDANTLTAYPFRVMGLPERFNKRYKVKMTAGGVEHETSAELNWGQVTFHDPISSFNMGDMPQTGVLTDAIKATLIEVDDAGADGLPMERELGSASVLCHSLLSGECQPTPTTVDIMLGGEKVSIELAILWQDNPIPWFASRIRGVALSFPKITMREAALREILPELQSVGGPSDKFYLRITHAGRSYVTEVSGPDKLGSQVTFVGTKVLDLGPTFLESWMPCEEEGCEAGKLELYYGSRRIATNDLPEIPWNTVTDTFPTAGVADVGNLFSNMDASGASDKDHTADESPMGTELSHAFLAAASNVAISTAETASMTHKDIPLTVALTEDGKPGPPVAVVSLTAHVTDPSHSSAFLKPTTSWRAEVGGKRLFVWTTAFVNPDVMYTFWLSTLKVVAAASVDKHLAATSPSVGTESVLVPMPGSEVTVTAQCMREELTTVGFKESPCSFSHYLSTPGSDYSVGDFVVVVVEWMEGGKDHVIYSAPVEIVTPGAEIFGSIGSGRRLASQEEASFQAEILGYTGSESRRLWTQEDWDQRLAANKDKCEQKDLHFKVGFGMMTRAKLEDRMPAIFPMIGQKPPQITTGFQRLGEDDIMDSDAANLLPKWLCSDGVCSGRMPGCTEGNFEKLNFPELMFNFNRDYKYSDMGEGTAVLKEILAYAFSTMPEAIELMIERLNSSGTTTKVPFEGFQPVPQWPAGSNGYAYNSGATPPMYPGMPAGAYPNLPPGPVPGAAPPQYPGMPPGPYPSMPQQYPGMPEGAYPTPGYVPQAPTATLAPLLAPAWLRGAAAGALDPASAAPVGTSRRLPAADAPQAGAAAEVGEAQGRRVRLRFKRGVHYKIDRPLIEMMMRHGMFQEVEDDLSRAKYEAPLTIADFEVYSNHDEDSSGLSSRGRSRGSVLDDLTSGSRRSVAEHWLSSSAFSGVAAVAPAAALASLAAAAAVAVRWRRGEVQPPPGAKPLKSAASPLSAVESGLSGAE